MKLKKILAQSLAVAMVLSSIPKCQMNSWNSLLHGARLQKRTAKTKIK